MMTVIIMSYEIANIERGGANFANPCKQKHLVFLVGGVVSKLQILCDSLEITTNDGEGRRGLGSSSCQKFAIFALFSISLEIIALYPSNPIFFAISMVSQIF